MKSTLIFGSIQSKTNAPCVGFEFDSSNNSSTAMIPVLFKTMMKGTQTVLMASNASMTEIRQRFAEEICYSVMLSHPTKRHRALKAMAVAAASAELARGLWITCNGRVLHSNEETLADICRSAGATIEVSIILVGGMKGLQVDRHRYHSMDRAGIEGLVRQLAREAADASEPWRRRTKGGTRVTSHDLRSVFMNQMAGRQDHGQGLPGQGALPPARPVARALLAG